VPHYINKNNTTIEYAHMASFMLQDFKLFKSNLNRVMIFPVNKQTA